MSTLLYQFTKAILRCILRRLFPLHLLHHYMTKWSLYIGYDHMSSTPVTLFSASWYTESDFHAFTINSLLPGLIVHHAIYLSPFFSFKFHNLSVYGFSFLDYILSF